MRDFEHFYDCLVPFDLSIFKSSTLKNVMEVLKRLISEFVAIGSMSVYG